MNESDWMADRFQEHRPHLRAVAYRMLGSLSEADDALQEAWLRLDRSDTSDIENLRAWLTTVVARICLNALRSRKSRREESIDVRVAEPIVSSEHGVDPEYEALLADSVGLAMLVVLEQLTPAERLAFVLHDMFAVPFGEIAPMVGRSPDAARQLASRARRRVQDARPEPDGDPATQRRVVDAFFAAAHEGDFEALVAVLDPDVVLHSDGGPRLPKHTITVRGAREVAGRAITFASLSPWIHPALVNGAAGVVVAPKGRPLSVLAFTVRGGKIVEIDSLSDPDRLRRIDLSAVLDA